MVIPLASVHGSGLDFPTFFHEACVPPKKLLSNTDCSYKIFKGNNKNDKISIGMNCINDDAI